MIKYSTAYVPGTWDLFHYGHVRLLKVVSEIANCTVVAVNSDEWVAATKGRSPILNQKERIETMRGCKYADSVIGVKVPLDLKKMRFHEVDLLVIGSDWVGKELPGLEKMKAMKIKVKYVPYTESISSTKIRERMKLQLSGG